VFLDTADAGDCFRRDLQRLSFFAGLILGDPEVYNTVADHNVLRPDLRPLLATEFGEESGTDRPIVVLTLRRWGALCRPIRAYYVCAADDPDNFPARMTGTRLIRFASSNAATSASSVCSVTVTTSRVMMSLTVRPCDLTASRARSDENSRATTIGGAGDVDARYRFQRDAAGRPRR